MKATILKRLLTTGTLLASFSVLAENYTITTGEDSKYAAPTNIVHIERTSKTPKNIWVTLTLAKDKLVKNKKDGSEELTYRSDECPESFKSVLAYEGALKNKEVKMENKTICVESETAGPCSKKMIQVITYRCRSKKACDEFRGKHKVCIGTVKRTAHIRFKNVVELQDGEKEVFSLQGYINTNRKKSKFTLGQSKELSYAIKNKSRKFILVKGKKGDASDNDASDEQEDSEQNPTNPSSTTTTETQAPADSCLPVDKNKFLENEKITAVR